MTPPLYTASVPVFRHYLGQAEALVRRVEDQPALLHKRLAADMFNVGEQLSTAAHFAPRICYPLAGRAEREAPSDPLDPEGLLSRLAQSQQLIDALDPAEFAGAEQRVIRHRAGFAELEQRGPDFLHLFGMPNFLFHLSMAFAILRSEGVTIGKADFDGQHDYPPGFRF